MSESVIGDPEAHAHDTPVMCAECERASRWHNIAFDECKRMVWTCRLCGAWGECDDFAHAQHRSAWHLRNECPRAASYLDSPFAR